MFSPLNQANEIVGNAVFGTPGSETWNKGIMDVISREYDRQSQDRNARLQAQAQMLPAQLQQQRFGQVFPYMQDLISRALGGGGSGARGGISGGGFGGYGGGLAGVYNINTNPIWNQQQIQQQVNAAAAQNAGRTATNIRGMQGAMAGRGMGSNSPLSQALAAQYQGQGLAASSDAARNIRWNAAQGNAEHVLKAQNAMAQQYSDLRNAQASLQSSAMSAAAARQGSQNQLLAALAGQLGGLV